jgi:hypothetical protein
MNDLKFASELKQERFIRRVGRYALYLTLGAFGSIVLLAVTEAAVRGAL